MSIQHSTPTLPPPPQSGTNLRSRALAAVAQDNEERRRREDEQSLSDIQERIRWIGWFAERMGFSEYVIEQDARRITVEGLQFSVAIYNFRPQFHILEPCVACHELTPHTAIDSLLDLGYHLEREPEPEMCPACARNAAEAEEVAA